MRLDDKKEELAQLLKLANAGDRAAYRLFLERLTPFIRGTALHVMRRIGTPQADLEDAVQETMLAIHLKRHTWHEDQPIGPWLFAITRYKLIDFARKHGRRKEAELGDDFDLAAPEPEEPALTETEMNRLLNKIGMQQRSVVTAISLKGATIRDVALELKMTEGAVRVALHRGLKALAEAYQRSTR